MTQVISYSGIDEGNSNTSCSVLIVGRNGRMRMVSLTNNLNKRANSHNFEIKSSNTFIYVLL